MSAIGGDCWLTTERLALRRFTPADLDWLVELYSDPDVTRYLGGVKDRVQTQEILSLKLPRISAMANVQNLASQPRKAPWPGSSATRRSGERNGERALDERIVPPLLETTHAGAASGSQHRRQGCRRLRRLRSFCSSVAPGARPN